MTIKSDILKDLSRHKNVRSLKFAKLALWLSMLTPSFLMQTWVPYWVKVIILIQIGFSFGLCLHIVNYCKAHEELYQHIRKIVSGDDDE